jgi:hypothetical protein
MLARLGLRPLSRAWRLEATAAKTERRPGIKTAPDVIRMKLIR